MTTSASSQTSLNNLKQEEVAVKESLIERIREFDVIWNISHKDYLKSNVKANCWLKILKDLEQAFAPEVLKRQGFDTVAKIKDVWQKMRGVYRKNKSKTVGPSGAAADAVLHPEAIKWPFFSKMTFLDVGKDTTTQTVSSLMEKDFVKQVRQTKVFNKACFCIQPSLNRMKNYTR